MADKTFLKAFKDIVSGRAAENPAATALGVRMVNEFATAESDRRPKEQEWLRAVRQMRGVYDPEDLKKIKKNASRVYPKLTKARIVGILSRLHEMLFPDKEMNWGIDATPIPKIPKNIVTEIIAAFQAKTGKPPDRKQLNDAIAQYAKISAELMMAEIEDQIVEMHYETKIGKPTLKSGLVFGTGVTKGPLNDIYQRRTWEQGQDELVEKTLNIKKPYYEYTQIWYYYPDMTVTEQDQCNFEFELHIMTPHELTKLSKRKDFNGELIRKYMVEHPDGDCPYKLWERDLRMISVGNENVSDKNVFESEGTGINTGTPKRFQVIERWGVISGRDLQLAGISLREEDLDDDIQCQIWLLKDGTIIKVAVANMPDQKSPFKLFYYEKDDTSIFGEGLPAILRDSQLAISASARLTLDNAAITGGPQFEINYLRLVSPESADDIYSGKIWWTEARGADAQYPAVRVYNIDSHISEYLAIIKQFKEFGDEETTLPTWFMGEPAKTNETVGGLSMRLGTMTVTLKDLVRNFDEYTCAVIEGLYYWNMKLNPKKEIKGDYKVNAKGSASLVMKEVQMQAMNQFATTLTPEDWAYVPRRQFLEQRVKVNDLDIELRSEEEAQAYLQSLVDARAKELEYRTKEADIDKTKAMALHFGTKAKKENVEAYSSMNKQQAEAANPPKTGGK